MRPHVFSPNNCILRHALPIMLQVQSCKSLLSPISPILLHRSTNNSQILLRNTSTGIPRHATLFTANTCSLRKFSTRATDLNDAGSIDSPLMQAMENKIKEHLNAEAVTVKDAYGDGRHVSIDVVSTAFEGQSALDRQRMVYKAIWEELQTTVHAVDRMTTRTPAEAAKS